MNLTLKIWRQKNAKEAGKMVDYKINNISPDMSFLEMLDVLNNELIEKARMRCCGDTNRSLAGTPAPNVPAPMRIGRSFGKIVSSASPIRREPTQRTG